MTEYRPPHKFGPEKREGDREKPPKEDPPSDDRPLDYEGEQELPVDPAVNGMRRGGKGSQMIVKVPNDQ